MSTGGIFQLIANTGKQDQMLTATALLNKRLREISRVRCRRPEIKDPTPTLVDIERTHIMFMNAHFKPFVAIGYEYAKIGVQEGEPRFGQEVVFSIPQFGDFFHDMVVNVRLLNLTVGTATQCRYCDFLGHRLFKNVRFEVNANNLDEYDSDTYNFHYNFMVSRSKRAAWLRNVGQEIPNQGFLTRQPLVDEFRELKFIVDGPQTPKVTHPVVDLWIPLLFWFNRDPRLSIPSVSIPYGQRFIGVELARLDEIAVGLGGSIVAPVIDTMELYINNIFVNPEIHDIFIKRVGFSLIRVHRTENANVDTEAAEVLFDQLKYPTETVYIGIRPTINIGTMDDWHRFNFVIDNVYAEPVAVPNPAPPPANILAFAPVTWKTQIPTIRTLQIETHGIEIYREFSGQFFNSYLPYKYGGYNITAPDDPGMLMATFNMYPGSYQPSGHLNLSRSREFYVNYTSDIITPVITGVMTVITVAINFLLISEGSAVLRYNT